MEFTAGQIASLLNGKVEGDPDAIVSSLAKIEEGEPGALSFLDHERYVEYLYSTRSTIVLVRNEFAVERMLPETLTLIRVADPRLSMATLLEEYHRAVPTKEGRSELAFVDPSATLGDSVYVGPNAHIGANSVIGAGSVIHGNAYIGDNVTLGNGCVVHAHACIQTGSLIGKECTFHPGVIIGADGFGFAPSDATGYKKVPQVGNVVIEDYVEIGANTCVDRATMGSTIIRKGVKLDNLIQIGHNAEIGAHTVIASQTGVSGSTKIGERCLIGGQVGFVGHISIANGVKIAAQSGILRTIEEENSVWQGSPAFPIGDYKRSYVLFRALPKLKEQLDNLIKASKSKEA
jgi:UDP-3-O-[3-hydroxymyristoyl] glucosamine N-acyltransferase